MPHYGTLQDYRFEDVEDVRGSEVYGVNNEKLGKVEDVLFDHSTGEICYVVVDADWLSNRKVLVPINRIQPYGTHEDAFYAELDKERMQMLPEFNQQALESDARWSEYEKHYQERWSEGTVIYNKDTGRIVTPPIDQVQGTRTKPLSEEGKRSLKADFTPERVGKEDGLLGVASSGDDITLTPQKPSMGGQKDVELQQESSRQGEKSLGSRDASADVPDGPMQEPGVYVLERPPEVEKKAEASQPGYGRRWIDFQQKLREGRDQVVSNCPLCGTHDKAA